MNLSELLVLKSVVFPTMLMRIPYKYVICIYTEGGIHIHLKLKWIH